MSMAAGRGTKGMPSDDRREGILNAAIAEFADRGFAGTSMVSIAGRAGISKALVYQHFGSKDQLYTTCVTHTADPLLARMDAEMTSGADPFAVPLNALRGIFETLGPDGAAWRILHDPSAPVSGVAAELVERYRQRIAAFTVSGVTEFLGALGDTDALDIDALAKAWTAIVDAVVTWAIEHPGESPEQLTRRFGRLMGAVFSVGAARDDRTVAS